MVRFIDRVTVSLDFFSPILLPVIDSSGNAKYISFRWFGVLEIQKIAGINLY